MLRKHRITRDSIPDGLMKTSAEFTKGMIVGRKLNPTTKEYEIVFCGEDVEAYGFITLREDEAVYKESYYDEIPAGTKATVYTLVKNHEWRTDQFDGQLDKGDKVIAGTNGKLQKSTQDSDTIIGEIVGVSAAMAGYENAMVTVKLV